MFGVCLYFLCYCCLCWGIIVIACCYSFFAEYCYIMLSRAMFAFVHNCEKSNESDA